MTSEPVTSHAAAAAEIARLRAEVAALRCALVYAQGEADGYAIDDGSVSWRNGQEHAASKIGKAIRNIIKGTQP